MPVSEDRIRAYKRARRAGLDARQAAWVTTPPRYDVNPYDSSQDVTAEGETFRVHIDHDDDAFWLFREDIENGIYADTDDDRDSVYYFVISVDHPSGVSSSLGGVSIDDRVPFGERYLSEEVCEVIDEVRAQVPSVARALMPFAG